MTKRGSIDPDTYQKREVKRRLQRLEDRLDRTIMGLKDLKARLDFLDRPIHRK